MLGAALAVAVFGLGISAPLSKGRESLSAQLIEDAAEHGHWVLLSDSYGCVARKPPLFYLLSALVVRASGERVDEVRIRVVSLAAAVAVAVEVLLWTAARLGWANGWLALLFLLGTYGFASRAALSLTDMLLAALTFGGYCLLYPLLEGDRSCPRALIAGAVLGLAVLTKGPIALALCALAVLIYLAMTGRGPLAVLRRAWPWQTLAAALALGALWYLPALTAGHGRYLGVVVSENWGHFVPAALGGTGEDAQPWYFIVVKLLGAALPLNLLAPALLAALVSRAIAPEHRRALAFQLALVLAVVALFSAANSQRADYVLPALPGLPILYASLFTLSPPGEDCWWRRARLARDLAVGLTAFAMAAAVIAAPLALRAGGVGQALKRHLWPNDAAFAAAFIGGMRALAPPFVLFSALVVAGALLAAAGLRRRAAPWCGAALGLLSAAGVILWDGALRPQLARGRTVKPVAAQVHRLIGDAPLFIASGRDNDLSFYYGHALRGLNRGLEPGARADQPVYLIASARALRLIDPALRGRLSPLARFSLEGGDGSLSLYRLEPGPNGVTLAPRRGPLEPDCGT